MRRLAQAFSLIEAGVTEGLHLGAQLHVVLRGEVVADAALGEAGPGTAMTTDSLVLWLSACKPVTAVAIAQQWEQGHIDLDAPVGRYVPEFAQHGKEAVTVRHLLTHTGGFRAEPYRFPRDDWPTILEHICEMPLEPRWVPGHTAGYHATSSWFILGEVLQRVTGVGFSSYLREHVFEPTGMHDSWIGMPIERYETYGDRLGVMMKTEHEPAKVHPWASEPGITQPNPGANAHGPIRELGRLYQMLLGGGELDGARVLEPATVELFTAPQRVGIYDRTFRQTIDWGLGFLLDSKHHAPDHLYGYGPHASRQTFGHSGKQCSVAFADPVHELVVALHFNGQPGEAKHHQRTQPVLAALYEDLGLV